MLKRKQLLLFILFWTVLMSGSKAYIYAQDTPVEKIGGPAGAPYAEGPEAVYDEDYGYEEEDEDELSGPFRDGFAFNDSLDKTIYSKKNIADTEWNKISSHPEFKYEKEGDKKVSSEQGKDTNKFFEWLSRTLASFFGFLVSDVGKIMLWTIVAVILCLLIFLIFKRRGIYLFARSKKKIKKIKSEDETGDDFIPESWESVIQQAEVNGNYRLAVRHSFRHILHLMETDKIISLEKSLSNHQILGLLRQRSYYDDFRQLLRHYEYIWYGAFNIHEQSYARIKAIYVKLRDQL